MTVQATEAAGRRVVRENGGRGKLERREPRETEAVSVLRRVLKRPQLHNEQKARQCKAEKKLEKHAEPRRQVLTDAPVGYMGSSCNAQNITENSEGDNKDTDFAQSSPL